MHVIEHHTSQQDSNQTEDVWQISIVHCEGTLEVWLKLSIMPYSIPRGTTGYADRHHRG